METRHYYALVLKRNNHYCLAGTREEYFLLNKARLDGDELYFKTEKAATDFLLKNNLQDNYAVEAFIGNYEYYK